MFVGEPFSLSNVRDTINSKTVKMSNFKLEKHHRNYDIVIKMNFF